MLRVAIGPETPLPSWNWVGFDLARELSKYFHVAVFQATVPACDVVIAVKFLPALSNGVKSIYLPIDRYTSREELLQDAPSLTRCHAIGCHSELLVPEFAPFCHRVFFIEHHAKYALGAPAPFKPSGPIIWIGAIENAPYLLKWLDQNPFGPPLMLLSNAHHKRARDRATVLAAQLGIELKLTHRELNGHLIYPWSERTQREFLKVAKAAIDIKGGPWSGIDSWSQQTKPPAKAQKFVASGVPLAVNQDSSVVPYFARFGLNLASPGDSERWFSDGYWRETNQCAQAIRPRLSLQVVGDQLKNVIHSL